ERGHKNVWDCERIFNQVKTVLRRLGIDVLGTFTVGAKDTCPPLMLADFLAGTYSMMRAARGGVSVQTYQDIAPMPAKREAGLTFLELLPDALTKLKTDFERLRQHEVEEWRARKEARKAALASSAVRAALASPPRLVVASGGRAS
ncbi:MAG TPA: hypothetical protein VLV50_11315, partial [Stellaceae bacterium]|nr:hypothetical protein [Stellaceae bacterium]